jgi:peptidyl-prolyl cis-trans isomerase A (cyclophilin A)
MRLGAVLLAGALALPACKKDDAGAGGAAAKDGEGTKAGGGGGGGGAPPPPPPGGDPEKGEFTLDEATAGLAGEGKQLWARITTDKGVIECELYADKAPITVASFVGLARGLRPWQDPKTGAWKKEPFFDGLAFHRVIPKFMIQGGDPLSRDYARGDLGTGGPGYELKAEFDNGLVFDRPGRLAMARSDDPNSAGSQFFITEEKRNSLSGKYTVFGQCGNEDVVKEIARVPRDEQNGDKPNQPVTMRVEIFKR